MAYIGSAPTAVPLTSSDMDDGIISTAKLADNAVSLAKMASGTDGNIITYDASGDPAFAVTGTSGQVLTSGGAGVAPTFATASGGAWTYISTATASASASVVFTSGLDSTYDQYVIVFTSVVPASDSQNFMFKVSDDAGSTYEATNYDFFLVKGHSGNGTIETEAGPGATAVKLHAFVGNASGEGCSGLIHINNPSNSSLFTMFHWKGVGTDNTPETRMGDGVGSWNTTTAVDAVQFAFASGNITSGTFRLYGINNS